jgi:hypothetical protein
MEEKNACINGTHNEPFGCNRRNCSLVRKRRSCAGVRQRHHRLGRESRRCRYAITALHGSARDGDGSRRDVRRGQFDRAALQPYLVQLPAVPGTSKEAAAAAAAAAAILVTTDAKIAGDIKVALASYLGPIPDAGAKSDGVKLGEAVAGKVLEARANDGSDAPDAYRPRTTAGVYVPTPITAASMWPDMKPFAIARASQFRPGPPILLESKEWDRLQ